jgi:hypothetical protein
MTAGSDREPDDPLKGASESFEEHERDLLEELTARVQRDIPKGATVGEAIAEMQRAMFEEEDVSELLLRTAVLQNLNRGYIRTYFEELSAKQADLGADFTAAIRGRPLSREELDLMQKLGEEIDRRLPPDLPEDERGARVVQLLKEDEELAKMASRLERLAAWGGTLPPHEQADADEAE